MKYDAKELKARLDNINSIVKAKQKRGKRAPYKDEELETIIKFVGYIESNRENWEGFELKSFFKNSEFTHPMYRDFKRRFLKPKEQRQTESLYSDKPVKEYEPKREPKTKEVGRPKNEVERKRIATYIDHRLNKKMRVYAALEGIGLNEVLERALNQFFKDKLKDIEL